MKYNLDCVYEHILRGEAFFSDFEQNGEDRKNKFRYMISKSTGMVSIHHFRNNIPVDESYFVFKNTMNRRFRELDKIFIDAKSICIVTSRKQSSDKIVDFIKKFLTLYHFEQLYFINIYNNDEEKIEISNLDNAIIYNCYFKDVHPLGNNAETNSKFWKGNIEYWDKILSKISLNKDFVKKYRIHKVLSNITGYFTKTAFKISFINFKCKLFRILRIKTN